MLVLLMLRVVAWSDYGCLRLPRRYISSPSRKTPPLHQRPLTRIRLPLERNLSTHLPRTGTAPIPAGSRWSFPSQAETCFVRSCRPCPERASSQATGNRRKRVHLKRAAVGEKESEARPGKRGSARPGVHNRGGLVVHEWVHDWGERSCTTGRGVWRWMGARVGARLTLWCGDPFGKESTGRLVGSSLCW